MIDDFCKQLVARHPASVGGWVLGRIAEAEAPADGGSWQLLDRELSSAPLHADSVVLLPEADTGTILHLEFQTRPDAAIAERMLDYWIRLHRRFHQPIRQAVIHLKPTGSRLARIEELTIGNSRHRFNNLRLWEQDPAPLVADPALLPLAVLARPTSPSRAVAHAGARAPAGDHQPRSAPPHRQRLPTAGRPSVPSRRDSTSPRHEHS